MIAELVVGVGQPATVDGQAAASHTVGEIVAELLEIANPLIKLSLPAFGYSLPIAPGRGPAIR